MWIALATVVVFTLPWAVSPWFLPRFVDPTMQPSGHRIPLAVLGDSDSHGYHDTVSFPVGGSARGGSHRPGTFQWTEVLARLRGDQLDLGPKQVWGLRRSWAADILGWVGIPSRHPVKEDHLFNMAFSGAVCEELMKGPRRQAPRLLALMNHEPERWRNGVVVVRIGINDLGDTETLEALSRDPRDAQVAARIAACATFIRETVALIGQRHPTVRFVLTGLFNNAHWARNHARWHSPQAQANIAAGLAPFDDAMRAIAAGARAAAFFDDQRWFDQLWGGRNADGLPDYRRVRVGRGFEVGNSEGDHPRHATVADGHAGAVWNALWARALVALVNDRFGFNLRPIEEGEIAALLDPEGRLGLR
ncbi:MAG: SGNH/GDSL hydrolase family protein [Rubrivivax sp.]|nr:SGNH/GDSL hydrolase family protein [Rubrivivax sp.]